MRRLGWLLALVLIVGLPNLAHAQHGPWDNWGWGWGNHGRENGPWNNWGWGWEWDHRIDRDRDRDRRGDWDRDHDRDRDRDRDRIIATLIAIVTVVSF